MKYVRETKAGKSVSAYVILDKKGKEVASVHAHLSDSGVVLVNVFNYGKDNNSESVQAATASGYGYDKFTAALSGLVIDAHRLSDHCGKDSRTEKLMLAYIKASLQPDFQQTIWNTKAEKIGARFANYSRELGRYRSLHRLSGLDYLTALGYRVIHVI